MLLRSLRKNITWRAIPIAGLAGGTAFLLFDVLLTPLVHKVNGVLVLRYIASLVLGNKAVMDGGAGVVLVGIVVHYVLSLFFALVIAVVVHRWGLRVGIIGGAILGLAFYGINLYTITLLFPWFVAINSLILLLSHVLFGMVAGGVYESLDKYDVEGHI
jgi:hypothetical protein